MFLVEFSSRIIWWVLCCSYWWNNLMNCFLSLSCQCHLNFSFYAKCWLKFLTQSSVFKFIFV